MDIMRTHELFHKNPPWTTMRTPWNLRTHENPWEPHEPRIADHVADHIYENHPY